VIKKNSVTKKGFTLIELLVVVAILGALAAIGVYAFNGYIKKAKSNVAKSNHKIVCRAVAAEAAKIIAGMDDLFYGNISTSSILSDYYSDGNPMGKIAQAAIKAFRDDFKNPYGDQGKLGDIGVTDSGWGKEVDLGYTIIDPQGPHDGLIGILHIHTCIELPCTGDYKVAGGLPYILYCPITFSPD
tara:strand:- start:55 stop:612 length:558 start_codon:yes stop_codon:yes gene_type:complete